MAACRLRRDLSQSDLARLAKVPPSAISQVERGERGLSLETLMALSGRLNITLDELLGGEVTRTTGSAGATASATPRRLEKQAMRAPSAVARESPGSGGGLAAAAPLVIRVTAPSRSMAIRALAVRR